MEHNIGPTDQRVRLALGALLGIVSLAILGGIVSTTMMLAPVLGALSLILLVTAVTSWCGLYSALGISTD